MKCPCPKCDVLIEMSVQERSADGGPQRCPECKEKYWIRREEFMLRAYRKQGKVYCFDCGHELGHETLCRHCNSLCPDYSVVQSSRFVARNQKKAQFSLNFTRRPEHKTKRQSPQQKTETITSPEVPRRKMNKSWLGYAAVAVLVLFLFVGLTKVYLSNKADQEYAKKFVVALYGVKSGTDLSLGIMNGMTSEWKKNLETANIAPRTSQKDLDRLKTVRSRIAQAMEGLNESPEKFVGAKETLTRLHGVYEEIYTLNISNPDAVDVFSASVDTLETKFNKVAGELKSVMPEELIEELEASVAKYRNLDFLVDSK